MTQTLHDVITRLLDAEIGADGYVATPVPGLTLMRTTLGMPSSPFRKLAEGADITAGTNGLWTLEFPIQPKFVEQ